MSEPERIEYAAPPGTRLSDALNQAIAEHGAPSAIQVGNIVIAARVQRACDAAETAGGPSCSFCCERLGVAALKKYPRQTCRHLLAHRCTIYETRPESCSVYQCAWKAGNWPLAWRPDKVGCVVTFFEDPKTGQPLAVMTIDSARADRAAIKAMVDDLGTAFPIIRLIVDDREVVQRGPDGRAYVGRIRRERGVYEDAVYEMREVAR
jgi:hypothetical protein